ncbi:MAG: hypothetical protein GEU96_12170 [Propionibacteriales bacterium]|nr:hypothetical protein [Propionibacteriales bacterium]
MSTVHVAAGVGLALSLGVGGCSAAGGEGEPDADAPVDLVGSFVQQRTDEGTTRAHVRLTNDGDSTVQVDGVGLVWPGYDDRVYDTDASFRPGATIDLSVELTGRACAPTDKAPRAQVRMGERTLTLPLDDSGTRALHNVWERACAAEAVAEAVDVRFGPEWVPGGRKPGAPLRGTIEVTRGSADGPVALTGLQGSVLLDLEAAKPSTPLLSLPAEDDTAALPVTLGSNGRCDAHALGGSTQTFLLRVLVSLDGGEPQAVILGLDKPTQSRVLAAVHAACGVG